MHSPLWHVAWSALQGPVGPGGRGGFLEVVVVVGGVVKTGGPGFISETNPQLNKANEQGWFFLLFFKLLPQLSSHIQPVLHAEANCYNLPAKLKPLTTIGLITHVSAVCSVVTQVFHQDTCPITTPVFIWHAGSDARGDYERCRGGRRTGEPC